MLSNCFIICRLGLDTGPPNMDVFPPWGEQVRLVLKRFAASQVMGINWRGCAS